MAVPNTHRMRRRRLRRFEIVEDSMRPCLEPGDWVVARSGYGHPRRGDVIVFTVDRFTLVKRVVGLPGESIEIAEGRVRVHGDILAERWADGGTFPAGRWVVPEDAVWVLGDSRERSTSDSRTIGPVPIATIGWKIMVRYWPPARSGMIR